VGSLGDGGVAASRVAPARRPASAPTPPRPGDRRRSSDREGLSAPARSRGKRALDLGVALLAAPIVLPLALVCALLIKLTSRGPALFKQQRVGLGGRSFSMYKFRTMRHDAEERLHRDPELWRQYVENDYKLPVSVDPRVTRLGRWLRRTSIDELPQLINVVAGTMSIVGPRPVTRAQFEAFADVVDAYQAVRPGPA
jgi:lipopolysaccharide/colanic/teichoic acid biosynthesis glycosyltransferase